MIHNENVNKAILKILKILLFIVVAYIVIRGKLI